MREAGLHRGCIWMLLMIRILACRKSMLREMLRATVPVHDGWGEGAPDLRGKSVTLVLADNGVAQRVVWRLAKPRLLRTPHSHCGKWC